MRTYSYAAKYIIVLDLRRMLSTIQDRTYHLRLISFFIRIATNRRVDDHFIAFDFPIIGAIF